MFRTFCKKYFFRFKSLIYLKLYADKNYDYYKKSISLISKSRFDENTIRKELDLNGYYVFDSLLNSELINILKNEFDEIIKIKSNIFDKNITKTVQIRNYDKSFYLKNKFLLTYILFTNPYIKKILKKVLNTKIDYNSEIFFQKTFETKCPLAGDFHFDKQRSIKIWFYVNDCEDQNGPLEIIKGTHHNNRILRINLGKKKLNKEKYNLLIDNVKNGVRLNAKAGSMIIFDSDVSHRASQVKFGKFREIIRGATFG
jgi:hypothetical protein